MDGNRRYAKKKELSKKEGYKAGMEQFLNFVKYQIKYNIEETSFFALSNDNYSKRPIEEMETLGNLVKGFSENIQIWEFFSENKIQIGLKGYISEMEAKESISKGRIFFIKELKKKVEKHNSSLEEVKFKVNIALNYDGQEEIVFAVKKIAQLLKYGEIELENINAELIKNNIYFNSSPAPEIIVRAGDAPRISGFMLWDSEYSEIYLTKKLWPELREEDFVEILNWYNNLKRNFGE